MEFKNNYLYFGSTTTLNQLSNLYECSLQYKGSFYPSIEHIFVSLKFQEKDRHRFMIDGDLGHYPALITYGELFYGKKIGLGGYTKNMEYWKKRKCIGIIAKISSNIKYYRKLGLQHIPEISDDEKMIIFKDILQIKFDIPFFRHILLKTCGFYLVEFSRSAKRNYQNGIKEKWTGYIENQLLYGHNYMGYILMDIRNNYIIKQ